jgi:hypothetical protein
MTPAHTPLPATLIPTLGKLIPRLASNHDGEILAAARAIGRALKSSGHDWHDLAASHRASVTQSPNFDWRRAARFCADHAALLNEREWDFIVTIAQGHKSPTEKQLKWLRDIADRLRSAA